MHKIKLAFAVALIFVISSTLLSRSSAADLADIQVGVYPITLYLPDYVARDKGFFAKNGLNATFVGPALSGATALQLMVANKLQVMGLDMFTALQANASGNPVRVIGCLAPRSIYVMVASKTANLPPMSAPFNDRMKALVGKTVGVTGINAGTDRSLVGGLAAASVPLDKVNRLAIGAPAAAIAQFNAGKIDAYVTGSYSGGYQVEAAVPSTTMYVDFGSPTSPSVVSSFAQGGWLSSGAWVKEHPEQVIAYRKAMQESVAWISKHPAEAAEIMSKDMYEGRDLPTATKSVDVQIKAYYQSARPDLTCDTRGFDAATKLFQEQGLGSASQFKFDEIVPAFARH